nr:MAG TPA: hypothetical protein [Caudoviricetes sp.]
MCHNSSCLTIKSLYSFSMYSFLLVFWIDESQSNMLDLL